MIVFTIIGIIVCAIAALVLVAGIALALMSDRVKIGKFKPSTCFRRYKVFYPDPEQDEAEIKERGTRMLKDNSTLHFTFIGARRTAKKVQGTRIFDRWNLSYSVARPGWSEAANGYKERPYYSYA